MLAQRSSVRNEIFRVVSKQRRPGWVPVRLGDVVRLSKTRSQNPLAEGYERFVGLEHLESGDLQIRSWGNVADGTTFTSLFQPGQVLFGKRRAYQRKVAFADFTGVCSGDIYVLESNDSSKLIPELLPFVCQTEAFFEHAVSTSAGSLSPRTNWTSLADFEFTLPPIEEQRRIANRFLAMVDARESQRAMASSARHLLASLLESVWGGTTNRTKALGEISAHLTSGSRGWAENYDDNGSSLFLRITNVQRRTPRLDLSDKQKVNAPSTLEATRTRVVPGDLLLSVTAELGLVGLIPDAIGEAYVNQHLALIRIDPRLANNKYVAWYLCSPNGQRQIARFNDPGAKAGMNLKNVSALQIPSVDLEEQSSIAAKFDAIDSALVQALNREQQTAAMQRRMSLEIFGGGNGDL